MRCFSRAICWIAIPEEEAEPSARASTPLSSTHCRAIEEATSGLFCSSACMISIGRPSTAPPTSSTASSAEALLPGPPLARYGPFMSLSRPIFIDFEEDCARRMPGRASGTAASAPSAARRVSVVMSFVSRWALAWTLPVSIVSGRSLRRRPARRKYRGGPAGHADLPRRLAACRKRGTCARDMPPNPLSLFGHGIRPNVAVVQPLPGIGDMIWHLPHLRALAAAAAGGAVTLIAKPRSAADQVLAAEPAVREVVWL